MSVNSSGLAFADYAVVVSFFAVMISVGVFFGRGQKNMSQFFGGGRQVPWWLSGISFYMCSFSALAFVMHSAMAYKYGILPIIFSWQNVPAVFFGCLLFSARWRRAAHTSPLEFVERRFSNRMRQTLMWMSLPMFIVDDAFKLLAIGTVVGAGMGFPLHTAFIVSGLIILTYTFMGGLWATLVADFIQFFVLLSVILVLPSLCLAKTGGFSGFMDQAPSHFFKMSIGIYTRTYIVCSGLRLFMNLSSAWSMVQRYYSTRSEKDALKVGMFVCVLLLVSPPLFYLPAMAARVFMPDVPEEGINAVYALLCKNVLPVGIVGMVIAAMFSATMSTLAGSYNAIASVLTNDFYKRMIAPNSTPKQQVLVARINTAIVGLCVICLTFVMHAAQGANDLFDSATKVFGIFSPPIAIPMLLGLTTRRVSRHSGLLGLAGGIIVGLIAFILGAYWPVLRKNEVLTIITITVTLSGLLFGSIFFRDDHEKDTELTDFFVKVNTPSPVHEGPVAKITFWPLVSGGLATIATVLLASSMLTQPLKEIRLTIGVGLSLLALSGFFWILSRRVKREMEAEAMA